MLTCLAGFLWGKHTLELFYAATTIANFFQKQKHTIPIYVCAKFCGSTSKILTCEEILEEEQQQQ